MRAQQIPQFQIPEIDIAKFMQEIGDDPDPKCEENLNNALAMLKLLALSATTNAVITANNNNIAFGARALSATGFMKAKDGSHAYDPEFSKYFEFKKHDLWPRPESAQADAEKMNGELHAVELSINGVPVCDVRAAWLPTGKSGGQPGQNRLFDFKIDTAAGKMAAERPLIQPLDPEQMLHPGQSARYVLRPWRMLPAGTKLKSIGQGDPWARLSDGDNIFGRPPNWTADD